MLAESSTTRAQMMSANASLAAQSTFGNLEAKILAGEQLSQEELVDAREYISRMLRDFENIHYQYNLGVIDDEIWAANLRGISFIRNNATFEAVYPGWPDHRAAAFFRESFIDLLETYKAL